MAEKRMFTRSIMECDRFISLPQEARLAYVYLILHADDDGFVDSPQGVLRLAGLDIGVLCMLVESEFLIVFDGEIYLIRHWHAHNKISRERHVPSKFSALLSEFTVDCSGIYVKSNDTALRLKIAEHFVRCGYLSSADGFIAYNAARGWRGIGGEDVKESFERYADEWERNYRVRHGVPFDSLVPWEN